MPKALNPTARRFVAAVAVFGGLAATAVLFQARPARADLLPLAVFGLLTLLAPLLSLRHRGNLPTTAIFQLSTSFAYALLLLVDPGLLIPLFWAYVLVDRFLNGRRWIHTLFNMGQLGLAAALAAAGARALDVRLTGPQGLTLPHLLLGAVPMVAFALTNHVLTHAIVRLASRRPLLPLDWYSRTGIVSELLMGASALTQAALWIVRPELFLLGAVPVVALHVVTARLVEREGRLDRRETEVHSLQELGLQLGMELDRDRLGPTVLQIVEQALESRGSLLAFPEADPNDDRLCVEAWRSFPEEPPTRIPTEGLRALLDDPAEIELIPDTTEAAARMPGLAFLPGGSALLAPLGGRSGRGLLVLGHDDSRRTFDESDRRRLATLVRFIDVALANARLVGELREMQSHLVQQEKLSALGMLVAGVAHELNNPLTAVLGYSELLGDDEPDPRRRRMMSRIASETKRAGKIVQNLLTFSRKHTSEHRRLDIRTVLGDVLEFRAYEQSVNNVVVVRDLADDLPEVDVDPHQFQQVFLNLITNAEHAVASADRSFGQITVRTRRYNGSVRIEIQDNGRGIRREHLKQVFLPFFTTKEVGQGTGLGLSICYGIVEAHGGRIDVRSRPDEGATFTIDLPVAQGAPAGGGLKPPSAPRTADPAVPGRMLVVDDEDSILRLVRDFLAPQGWVVEIAREGREALDLVRRHDFDVLLVDLRMPGMDGRAFYEELQRTRPELTDRVLFATGHGGSGPEEESWLAGRTHLLAKPFNLRELSDALADVLSGASRDSRIRREHRN